MICCLILNISLNNFFQIKLIDRILLLKLNLLMYNLNSAFQIKYLKSILSNDNFYFMYILQ